MWIRAKGVGAIRAPLYRRDRVFRPTGRVLERAGSEELLIQVEFLFADLGELVRMLLGGQVNAR